MKSFKNIANIDLNDAAIVRKQLQALDDLRGRLGKTHRLSDAHGSSQQEVVSVNPFCPDEVVARFPALSQKDVLTQIERGHRYFEVWRKTKPRYRQELMERLAKILEKRRFEFNALLITEVGKPWMEADADTCEAIDFVRYYALSLDQWISNDNLVRVPGQKNELVYIPLGLGAVIAPWNFPNAILCGMTTASLVTGNTVIMKPASDAALIAYELHQAILEAGFPPEACQLAIGSGAELGSALVKNAQTRFICFTGSREVGVNIYHQGSEQQPGQIWLKRMILEMGGKDGILVDETADVDQAAQGVVAAAYGYSGQKCSACSRLVVVGGIKDKLIQKVVSLTQQLRVGNPADPKTQMGPVVNRQSFEKVGQYIEIGLSEGKLLTGGKPVSGMGFTWQPTIFDDIQEKDRLFQEEIFGPVLSITRCKNFQEGLRLMNATEYGLTGAVYTRDEARKEQARQEFHVGNLYINRKCTGAMVGQHPFGGFNMSGTDSKAGGPDYLLGFLQPKTIVE